MSGRTVLAPADGIVWRCLPFSALAADTLYRLLRLRSEVFVVEQQCVFLDMDDLDAHCLHLLGESVDGSGRVQLQASVRLVPAGRAFAEASIGRVVTAPAARGGGLGHRLMAEAVRQLEALWGPQPIRIGAQAHLEAFYQRHGFVSDDKPYVEDGIPHLEMLRR
ncbi:GNAT family N-acetyltransferase [Hydrogenophaga electricum]|uniref:GNAT family N-acetyltransferase n=1 Tax=Hydrogenophaga electricum TaxID=1230953 RepID=UPI0024E04F8A|nr:GNAT family N-acetyltransferase [Hydrogenophaga electricum]